MSSWNPTVRSKWREVADNAQPSAKWPALFTGARHRKGQDEEDAKQQVLSGGHRVCYRDAPQVVEHSDTRHMTEFTIFANLIPEFSLCSRAAPFTRSGRSRNGLGPRCCRRIEPDGRYRARLHLRSSDSREATRKEILRRQCHRSPLQVERRSGDRAHQDHRSCSDRLRCARREIRRRQTRRRCRRWHRRPHVLSIGPELSIGC